MHNKTMLPQIGTGTADSSGDVSIALDTTAVPESALADVGTGSDAFNATIWAWDSAGQYNVTQAVIPEGHPFSYRASAGIDTITGKPALWTASEVAFMDSLLSAGKAIPAYQIQEGDTYRYSPITPLNSAPGLHAELKYTYTSAVTRQSEFELPTTQYISLSLTGNQVEENDRSVSTGIKKDGNYHRWVWADYYFIEYLIGCSKCGSYIQWQPDHFQGQVTDNNPDRHHKHDKKPIGHLAWKQPAFNRGPGGGWRVKITSDSIPFKRSSGNRQENEIGIGFTLGDLSKYLVGGSMKLQDLMTYGSITEVTWTYQNTRKNHCGRGYTRVLFAYHTDPVAAGRIQAACEPNSKV